MNRIKPWAECLQEIFQNGIPTYSYWEKPEEISKILNSIGAIHTSNHIFYPEGGGFDLVGAQLSNIKNCIEIDTGFHEILSPKRLSFHLVEDIELSYFRLELNELQPTGIYDENDIDFSESVCEIRPGNYIDQAHFDLDEYEDEPLPTGARLVVRRLKGVIVIFGKDSKYNRTPSTYDGRYNNFTEDEFFEYISKV